MSKVRRLLAGGGASAISLIWVSLATSAAHAATCTPEGGFPLAQITNDPGTAVLPFTYTSDASSAQLRVSARQGSQSKSLIVTGGPGAWRFTLNFGTDGPAQLVLTGQNPNLRGVCDLQVLRAISEPIVRIVKHRRVVVTFDRRRVVTSTFAVRQRGKTKRKTTTGAGPVRLSREVKPGRVKVELNVLAPSDSVPTEVFSQTYRFRLKHPA